MENFLEDIQQSKRWDDFSNYVNNNRDIAEAIKWGHNFAIDAFVKIPFSMQQGVYINFLQGCGMSFEQCEVGNGEYHTLVFNSAKGNKPASCIIYEAPNPDYPTGLKEAILTAFNI